MDNIDYALLSQIVRLEERSSVNFWRVSVDHGGMNVEQICRADGPNELMLMGPDKEK